MSDIALILTEEEARFLTMWLCMRLGAATLMAGADWAETVNGLRKCARELGMPDPEKADKMLVKVAAKCVDAMTAHAAMKQATQ